MKLPAGLFAPPIAHRGLWAPDGPPENSLSAFEAACRAGYGIELDVRLSADGEAMVFHDDELERMTGEEGFVWNCTAVTLGDMALAGGGDRIPTLAQTLDLVAGRAMLLAEIKTGPYPVDALAARTAQVLADYDGPAAVISFDAAALAWFAGHDPDRPRGLDAANFADADLAEGGRDLEHAFAALIGQAQPLFLALQIDTALGRLAAQCRANGLPTVAWTVRSAEEAARLAGRCDNFIFEGFSA